MRVSAANVLFPHFRVYIKRMIKGMEFLQLMDLVINPFLTVARVVLSTFPETVFQGMDYQ